LANPDHERVLKLGPACWNAWRADHVDTRPDLSDVNLYGVNLEGANLQGTDFTGARLEAVNLNQADLKKACLERATISMVRLEKANLKQARLPRAHIGETTLDGADLKEAYLAESVFFMSSLCAAELEGANLQRAFFRSWDSDYKTNLTGANFNNADLKWSNFQGANLEGVKFQGADLEEANLKETNLKEAKLIGTNLKEANLKGADLTGAKLIKAKLEQANLTGATLDGADLENADLNSATMVSTSLVSAKLTGCQVYGISAWDLNLEGATQRVLIRLPDKTEISVDDLEVAQFIYLLLNDNKIRKVIDTITSKVVLILGRFTDTRKAVLDRLRDELRLLDFSSVIYDFVPSQNQDMTDTVTLLARMARFVIADLTDPSSVQHELAEIKDVVVTVQPIILSGHQPYSMFPDLYRRMPGLLPVYEYVDMELLVAGLKANVIEPAEAKRTKLMPRGSVLQPETG